MLAKKTGRVVFIASEAALVPALEMAHYSATKTMQPSSPLASAINGAALRIDGGLRQERVLNPAATYAGWT